MRRIGIICAAIALSGASAFAQECEKPTPPEITLNPSTATQNDMAQAFKTFRAFERASGAYRDCLKTVELPGGPAEAEKLAQESIAEVRKLQQEFKALVDAIRSRGGSQ